MADSTHFPRYAKVDATWLPFWGQTPGQQFFASLFFCAGVLSTLLMWPITPSTPWLMASAVVQAALLFELTRSASSQLSQGLLVLRLAPAAARQQLIRRWRIHLGVVGLSLSGLHLVMQLWKASPELVVVWAALVLVGAVTLPVQRAAQRPVRRLWLLYGAGVLLGGLMLLDASDTTGMRWALLIGWGVLLGVMGHNLWHSASQWALWSPRRSEAPPNTGSWRARWKAWSQRWTFFKRTHQNSGVLARLFGIAGAWPGVYYWPMSDGPVTWKHACLTLWVSFFLVDLVSCKDLHWRAWLAPTGMVRQYLGWRVWRDTMTLVGLLGGGPALIWLSIAMLTGQTINWVAIGSSVVMLVLAATLAVWMVGRRLHALRSMGLELFGLCALAGMGWFAQAQWGLPGQLDPLTQALPLALAVLAFALWRISRDWQRADVYALAHRQPEPTGWETD